MAWHILICVTLLTVNIYGLTSGNEAEYVGSKNLIELVKRDVPANAGPKSIYAPLDKLLRAYLNPQMIEQWKYFGLPIHKILLKMKSYYSKNKHGGLSEMLEGLLCQVREMKYFGGKSGKTLDEMIENIDVKPKCSKKEQQEILGKIVKHLSLDYMLNPTKILDFLQSDLFEVYANFLNIPESQKSNIISYAASLAKHDVVNWKLFDAGKRFLCHLSVTNVSAITSEILINTVKKMMSEPKCSDDELNEKWKNLVTTFGAYIEPMLLQFTETAVTEVNKWPYVFMAILKRVNWVSVKAELDGIFEMISRITDTIHLNIQKSSNRKWTISALVKNFVCGMNITDFRKQDANFYNNWMGKIGYLDVCNEKQEEKAWDNFLNAVAKEYVKMVGDVNKSDGMDISAIRYILTDDQVRLIQYAIKVIGIKKLDVVVGMIWKNLKQHPQLKLNLDYIMKFLSCHMKESEIDSMDLDKMMGILSKFGQPLSCTPQGDWLKDILKLLFKLDYDMQLKQLDELQTYIGNLTTEDLKQAVMEVKELKDAAMASFKKISARSDDWIAYINKTSSVNMSIIATQLICFASKADFTTIPKMITSFGDIGACTETERIQSTEAVLKQLTEYKLDELREFLIALGIFTGQIDVVKVKNAVSKVIADLYKYTLEIEKIIPQALKDLTIAKVMSATAHIIKPIDDCMTCMLKAILWEVFEQPGGPTLMECLFPEEKNKMNSGKKPGGDIEDRYKVGFDFPFNEKPVTNKTDLLEKLLDFTRDGETEKEERILKFVTKVSVRYLIDNPDKLNEYAKNAVYKKRIMAMAASVGKTSKLLEKMNAKMDKETLEQIKGIKSRNQVKKILRKAMEDMEMDNKTSVEKKAMIKSIPRGLLRKAGADIIDKLYSPETKKELIESFKTQPKSAKREDGVDEPEETASLAKLVLVGKLMKNRPDKETMSLIMGSSLITIISIKTIETVPKTEACLMNMDTTAVTTPQIEYFLKSCSESVQKFAKTNPVALGKIITKLPKNIIESLSLVELIKVTAVACEYESELGIDWEITLMKQFLDKNLDLKINATKMSCVLKHVQKEFDLKPEECQVLGQSMLKRIAVKRAKSYKDKCMKFLKNKTITFSEMGSMNAYLTLDDIKALDPAIVLQGAVVLGKYINDPSVFNAIGKKISELKGFKDLSILTADQVEQAGIFIAALGDANKIPKESINKVFEILGKNADDLEMKKHRCIYDKKEMSVCSKMDPIIKKIVELLIASIPTPNTSRRKRSTTSCSCSHLMSLGMAALKVPATQMSDMICATNFDECMDGLSQITAWNDDHRKVFVAKAIAFWGQSSNWNSTHMSVASAIIPGLSTDQIKALSSFSRDNAFAVGKQNNWASEKLTETFLLFVTKQLNNNVSAITSFDLQTLGNMVCGISADNIKKIPNKSYINAANQIGSLAICSEAQYTAWGKKALQEYNADVTKWGLAEIASIGSVINGFSTSDLQKLSSEQIKAISEGTITKILPSKIAILKPAQIGYLTTSQAEMVTPAQKAKMTEEQKNILKKKMVGYEEPPNSGGQRIDGTNCMKMLTPLLLIASKSFVNLLSAV